MQGFSETVHLTKGGRGEVEAMKVLAEWWQQFHSERERLLDRERIRNEESSSRRGRDGGGDEARDSLRERMGPATAEMPQSVLGWPIEGRDSMGRPMVHGLPPFDVIMLVEYEGGFSREQDEAQFALSFGKMPPSAELSISNMMYQLHDPRQAQHAEQPIPVLRMQGGRGYLLRKGRSQAAAADRTAVDADEFVRCNGTIRRIFPCKPMPEILASAGGREGISDIPKDVFLDTPVCISEYERNGMYGTGDIMKSFCSQDYYKQQSERVKHMILREGDAQQKASYRVDYLKGSMRQLDSTVMNGSLRSTMFLYATKYLRKAGEYCCEGMKRLMSEAFINESVRMHMVMECSTPWREEDIFADHNSPVYARLMYRDGFQYYSFLEEVAYQRLNTMSADLTPQNLKGAKEILAGMVMHSMRSNNKGYIVLGAMVWWMDGKGNYTTRLGTNVNIPVLTKSVSGGLDFTLERINEWITTHEKVLLDCNPSEVVFFFSAPVFAACSADPLLVMMSNEWTYNPS